VYHGFELSHSAAGLATLSAWGIAWHPWRGRSLRLKQRKRADARDTMNAAIPSSNPFLVALRTFVAQIPCKHWRSAETVSRGGSTWQGLRALVGPSRGLSWAIIAANQSGQATLWARPEFSLFSTLNSPSIVCINCNDGLIHRPRHFRGGANTISAARLASHSRPRVSIT
jgi:hypothetical protein